MESFIASTHVSSETASSIFRNASYILQSIMKTATTFDEDQKV